MNRYKTNNNGELAEAAPLFASSWLALFDLLCHFYNKRRARASLYNLDKS